MYYLNSIITGVGLIIDSCVGVAAADAATGASVSSDVSVRIQSVRVSRATPDAPAKFAGRYYADGSPGVSLHLLMQLKNAAVLPLGRDAVTIDTFIDDTYQNLLSPSAYGSSYGSQPPVVSDDGSCLIFNVAGARPPADEASRIFVRGKIHARIARGSPQVATGKLPLIVGQGGQIGTFKTFVRGITDNGDSALSLTLAVQGDTTRILKVRALDISENGKELSDPKQTRIVQNQNEPTGFYQAPSTAYVVLRGAVTNSVPMLLLEYTFAEKADPVSVPFEAQVDIGVTKAGPVEPSKGRTPVGPTGGPLRPWPPPVPSNSSEPLPPRRDAFVPVIRTNAAAPTKTPN